MKKIYLGYLLTGVLIFSSLFFMASQFGESKKEGSREKMISKHYPYEYTSEDYDLVQKMNNTVKNPVVHSDSMYFPDIKSLEDFSDVIIIASPKKHLIEVEKKVKYIDETDPKSIYGVNSYIPLKISSIIKGEELLKDKNEIVGTTESLGFYNDKLNENKMSLFISDNEPLIPQKGYEYIFYLKYVPEIDMFIIPSNGQGLFNIDGRDEEAMRYFGMGGDIRKTALKKYQKEIEKAGIPIEWEYDKNKFKKSEETPPFVSSAEATVSSSETSW